jgi:hypothetical protein
VEKIIIDTLVSSSILNENIIKQLKKISDNVQWSNGKSVEASFKKIISLITQEA